MTRITPLPAPILRLICRRAAGEDAWPHSWGVVVRDQGYCSGESAPRERSPVCQRPEIFFIFCSATKENSGASSFPDLRFNSGQFCSLLIDSRMTSAGVSWQELAGQVQSRRDSSIAELELNLPVHSVSSPRVIPLARQLLSGAEVAITESSASFLLSSLAQGN
jgi:hypothetical protein